MSNRTIASALLYILVLAFVSLPLASRAVEYKKVSTPSFSVEVPDSWKMKSIDNACYQFSAAGQPRPEDYALEICSVEKGLNDAAYDSGIFDKSDKDNWITIAGPGSSKTADVISQEGWHGIQAIIDCGIDDPTTGFHAAAGDCYWAVASNGRRSLIVDTQGLYRDFDIVSRIMKSLRLK